MNRIIQAACYILSTNQHIFSFIPSKRDQFIFNIDRLTLKSRLSAILTVRRPQIGTHL